jgi:hypothetical protein
MSSSTPAAAARTSNSPNPAKNITGMYHGQFGDAKVTGTVKGDKVELSFSSDAGAAKYSGTLDGANKMKGTVDYGEAGKGTFTATRK